MNVFNQGFAIVQFRVLSDKQIRMVIPFAAAVMTDLKGAPWASTSHKPGARPSWQDNCCGANGVVAGDRRQARR